VDAADLDTRRSHTGYVIMMNGGPISWKSVKQKSVSLSTAESEWYAASEVGKELLYRRTQVTERGRDTLIRVSISSTNSSKIASSCWCKCRTNKMVADALTKNLPAPAFEQHRATMLGEDEAPFSAMMCRMQGLKCMS
jgi:hypothetical protein